MTTMTTTSGFPPQAVRTGVPVKGSASIKQGGTPSNKQASGHSSKSKSGKR